MPAVDLSLFKDRSFLSGTLIGAVMFAMLMAVMFLLPLFMQELLGFTATQSGLALMPRSLAMMVVMPIVGPPLQQGLAAARRRLRRRAVRVHARCMMSHYTLDDQRQRGDRGDRDLQGVGFACLFIPLTTVALARIPRHRLADATGLNSLLRQIGGSIGPGGLRHAARRASPPARAARLAAHLVAGRPEVAQRLGADAGGAHGTAASTRGRRAAAARRILAGAVARQASVLAFEKLFLLGRHRVPVRASAALLLKARPETTRQPQSSTEKDDGNDHRPIETAAKPHRVRTRDPAAARAGRRRRAARRRSRRPFLILGGDRRRGVLIGFGGYRC